MNFYSIESEFGRLTLKSILQPTDYPFGSPINSGKPTLLLSFPAELAQSTLFSFSANFGQPLISASQPIATN